jgi:hypothetical protein
VRPLAVLLLATLLLPTAGAFHVSPTASEETTRWSTGDAATWRSVAFHPSPENASAKATLVGGYEASDGETRSLIAEWTPERGLVEVYNRSGPSLVDVAVEGDGTRIVVGLQDTILLGEGDSFRDVWDESRFADEHTFYGLGAAFLPSGEALVSGSSLLRVDPDGSLAVVHGGNGTFFRSIDVNPASDYALVEAAIQRENSTLLGTIWRTNGYSELTREDHVEIYGRFQRGKALLNTISFAPNGTFATFAGRDGKGASFLTWSPDRTSCHTHENGDCHDHAYRYMGAPKPTGPATCVDWHPSGDYALVTGLEQDVLGYADDRMWAPLMHEGPDLLGCSFAPDGSRALAVGHNGTVVEVEPGSGPVVRVLDPKPGRLAPPETDQRFLVGVIERGEEPMRNVSGRLAANGTTQPATPTGHWWTLSVDASTLEDGRHHLVVNATADDGRASLRFPFLVNNDAFEPSTPEIRAPTGLEATNRDSDGLFTIRWEPLDEPVVYEIEQQRRGDATNTTQVLDAGSGSNATVRVEQDGTYFFRVRAQNSYAASNWSQAVSVEVVIDTDGDGVPDKLDPQPHAANQWGDPDGDGVATDVELQQCSQPADPNSTPRSDDDGDGIPNGIECEQGSDARDPDDPTPQTDASPEPSENETEANTSNGNGTQDAPAPGLLGLGGALAAAIGLRRRR